jgi:hypothetical protein
MPVRLLVKVPVPVPSSVLLSATVGSCEAELQHTPLAVISPPPSSVMLPPETAADSLYEETSAVVREASVTAVVVKLCWLP